MVDCRYYDRSTKYVPRFGVSLWFARGKKHLDMFLLHKMFIRIIMRKNVLSVLFAFAEGVSESA